MTNHALFAPAKLNLFLAITGRRPDGFHDLLSVVAPLDFGDTLSAELRSGSGYSLSCDNPDVPCDGSNLILKAAEAFVGATGWTRGVAFRLQKRIPMGAGLGGGSSNAVAALRALNQLAGVPLGDEAMARLAASLGSDCPLFLRDGPVVMRGRGEEIEPLAPHAAARLRGRRVLVFKPSFGVPTAWAYGHMAAMAAKTDGAANPYLPKNEAEERLSAWVGDDTAPPEALLFNSMEAAAFSKYLALPTLLDLLRTRFALTPRMTGSGSACFAFLPEASPVDEIRAAISTGWGESTFVVEASLT